MGGIGRIGFGGYERVNTYRACKVGQKKKESNMKAGDLAGAIKILIKSVYRSSFEINFTGFYGSTSPQRTGKAVYPRCFLIDEGQRLLPR